MEFNQPPVNLIMVTYGQSEMCTTNIERIMEGTDYPHFDLTVIDNCSLDNTWEKVKETLYKYQGRSQGIQTSINKGYGQGANLGASITSAPVIVFLNSDVYPVDGRGDWLTLLVDELLDNSDVAVTAPKLVKDGKIMGAGVVGTNKDRRIRGWQEGDNGQYDDTIDVLSVCGAVMAVKREYFQAYGGFDKLFFHYFEEEDLCWKLRYDGLRIRYVGSSVMVHDHMGSCEPCKQLNDFAGQGQGIFYQRWGQWMLEDETEYGGVIDGN